MTHFKLIYIKKDKLKLITSQISYFTKGLLLLSFD